jgi:hypothetical protein
VLGTSRYVKLVPRTRERIASIHRAAEKACSRKPVYSRSHPYPIGPAVYGLWAGPIRPLDRLRAVEYTLEAVSPLSAGSEALRPPLRAAGGQEKGPGLLTPPPGEALARGRGCWTLTLAPHPCSLCVYPRVLCARRDARSTRIIHSYPVVTVQVPESGHMFALSQNCQSPFSVYQLDSYVGSEVEGS